MLPLYGTHNEKAKVQNDRRNTTVMPIGEKLLNPAMTSGEFRTCLFVTYLRQSHISSRTNFQTRGKISLQWPEFHGTKGDKCKGAAA